MLVGFSAGGPADLTARALAEAVKPYFPQPFEIVNRPGGAAAVATAELVRARADGYTLCMCYGPALTLVPHINEVPYKGPDDVQPVILATVAPFFLVVRSDAPWRDIPQLVDYARRNPGQVRIGHSGIGSLGHIGLEMLNLKAGTNMVGVPFPGAADAVRALLSGDVHGINVNPAAVAGQLAAGQVRLLGAYTDRRVAGFEQVATFKEAGYDVVTPSSIYFVAAPRGTPRELVQKLYETFRKGIESEGFQKFARDNGFVTQPIGPDDLARMLRADYEFFRDFVKQANLRQ
jgi:tripartite-type tricarboxylate transporter receptor subunit TctC